MSPADETRSAVIYRCEGCGAIVHPADPDASLAAWCARCRRFVIAGVDGG
ncbi:MAG TPA: hypothetical protein VFW24_18180 [Acidimicrobiales bacterium]|nr:hypothetical protein [Acidimicrobiales bacterium]